MPELEWQIFYEDRSTFSNLDGEAWRAPRRGVQAIYERVSPTNHVIHKKGNHYIYDADWGIPKWRMMDMVGLWDYMFEPGLKCVLFGRYTSNERWNEIAVAAEEFGQKQSWLSCEQK